MKKIKLVVLSLVLFFSFKVYLFAYSSLKDAISDNTNVKEYSLVNDELVTGDLGQLGGKQLTILGNGYNINGNTKEGISLSADQILNIKNGTGNDFVWKEFSKYGRGGAIYNSSGTIVVNSTTFKSNSANVSNSDYSGYSGRGGAIYNTGTMIFNSTTFESNSASVSSSGSGISYGGAIYNDGTDSSVIINSTTFKSNSVIGYYSSSKYGGAIYNNNGIINIELTIFELNTTKQFNSGSKIVESYGGAIYNIGKDSNIIISSTVFKSNSAANGSGSYGGAIYNNNGIINISSTTFESNSARASSSGDGISYGGSIYNTGTMIFNSTTFESNIASSSKSSSNSGSVTGDGGAIYNRHGTIIVSSTTFESNSANGSSSVYGSGYGYGGAISNSYGIINIDSTTFESNSANGSNSGSGSGYGYGGAIHNSNGTITISLTTFESNSASGSKSSSNSGSGSGISYGGAIYNSSDDVMGRQGIISISSTIFKSNIASGSKTDSSSGYGYGYGGAIYNKTGGIINISSTTFESNSASGFNSSFGAGDGCGGAIYSISGIINISSTIFKLNSADGYNSGSGSGSGYGGAIYNGVGIITVSSTTFESNSASGFGYQYSGIGSGGAIYTEQNSKITFIDGVRFINNEAQTRGGAIYNDKGTINLIANIDNIEFTGNTANGISNAIYDNKGTINLWASENADIIFNDRITSSDDTSILNINSSTNTLTAIGKVIFNEDMSGYKGQINLYCGEIELQAKTNGDNVNTNKFFNGDINLDVGTLNILNNAIDNIIVTNLTTTSNVNLKFDVDLSNNTSDNFTVTNSTTGEINLKAINILNTLNDSGYITLFNNEKSPTINILTNGYYDGYEYIFTNSDIIGVLNYEKNGMIAKTFKEVINTTEPAIRSYSLVENEVVIENLGNLGGTQLTIFGNGYNIYGNSKAGIIVNEKQILNIENIKEIKSFNSENHGGFIYNDGGNIVNINDNIIFSSNNVNVTPFYNSSYGGALYNYESQMSIGNNVVFSSNSSITSFDDSDVYGGAIGNENYSKLIIGENAKFEYNYVEGAYAKGGAIYNGGHSTMTILSNVFFDSNYAISNNSSHGGAIKNMGYLTICDGAKFINNRVIELEEHGDGGAIYNIRILNLIANTNNIEFTGNTANSISNAIHDNNGIINLWASSNADIIFNDRITSEDNNSVLNINSSTTTLTANGKVILNEDMRGYMGQVNLYNGTIQLGENGILFGGNIFVDNATINMANEIIQQHNFKTLTVNNAINLAIDTDLENKQIDTISANSFSGNGKINVKAINVLSDAKENKTEILFTSSTVLKDKITSINTASSKLYKYDVNYNKDSGILNFFVTTTNSPIIVESQVARATGLITQNTVLNQAFSSIDNIRNRIIQAKQKGLLYASTADVIFESPNRIESGLWIRPFMSQDTISFDSFDVDNNLTGTLAGIDLVTGENSLLSFYLGYVGSNQKYEDIKVNQTGYIVGATGMIIKGKWYAGLTANINFNKAESQSVYGTDSFDLNMYSVGAKAGYNFDLSDNFILEPNLTLMYGNVGSQEYKTTQGAKIDSQSTVNIIAEPQVKAKLNLTNGWQPYGLLGYLINAGEKAKLVADNISFDDIGISGYVEYGVGVNKTFKNSPWSCYLQLTGKSGDISGFDGNIGIKYSFLNKEEKEDIELIKYLKEKEKKELKEQQEKQKAFEEEQKRIEKEEKERLEVEEKARIEEEKRIKQEEKERQKALEEERIKTEKEEQEKQRMLEIERKLQEYYD